jgi:DNA-binding NtrC family response regulator
MITAYGTISQAVEVMRLGAFDFITKPFSIEDLESLLSRIKSHGPVIQNNGVSPEKIKKCSKDEVAIITNNSEMRELIKMVTHIASSSANVLIQGESGTGKELIARLLHISNRNINGPFVAVNCAALPENLLESELFGHEKGAFTGALTTRVGKFEQANGGTLLLDEITEMPLSLQAKLLRVLQEREVDRVGGGKPIPVNVRVVATTNRNIQATVDKGEFREDLYYRLNVIPLKIPSLRDRKDDIAPLVQYFVRKFSDGSPKIISEDFSLAMAELAWTSFSSAVKMFTFAWDGFRQGDMKNKEHRIHPTQKPVKLYKWLLHNYAKTGDTILDTHGGSMSLAIACWDMGFDLDICELDSDYFDSAVKRFEQHIAQTTLF